MSEFLFVYGTLRSGRSNHFLAETSGLISVSPAIAPGLLLYHLETEGYPAVIPGRGRVIGEVLELTGGLELLDRLEGLHLDPPPYLRRRWRVTVAGGAECSVWIYLYARPAALRNGRARLVSSGDWQCR